MAKTFDKHNRMQQLTIMLKSHPEGLRKAEIARRLGVHRSTVGRYIDQLSLSMPLWERDSFIGLENELSPESDPHFNHYEGAFLLSLMKLYEQELNVKNPHASSVMRKLAEGFKKSAPILSENFLKSAELLDVEESGYSKGYTDSFEKLSEAWSLGKSVGINYIHESTGESCFSIFEPLEFFTCKNSEYRSDLAVKGYCRRTGELCRLKLSNFRNIDFPAISTDIDDGYQTLFCPISEYALGKRPNKTSRNLEELNIKESNHRIKNNLFMVSGLIEITIADIDGDHQEHTKQLQSRIGTIASLHGQLSSNGSSNLIQLNSYIPELITKTLKIITHDFHSVKKKIRIDEIDLRSSKALPLGMIVTELVMNSYKHSEGSMQPSINLSISITNGVIKLRYNDGGDGFRLNTEGETTGSDIIQNFCRQLDCSILSKDKHFILEFPV